MSKITYLIQDEIKKIFSVIKSRRDKALFRIAYRHGLRASEVGLLRRSDIDWDRMKIYVHRLKGGLSGEQIMDTDEVSELRSYLRQRKDNSEVLFLSKKGNPLGARQLNNLMKNYCDAAGIPKEKAHFHSLRHSIGVHLMDAGADVLFVRDILGHKNIQNTLIYAQITSARRDEIHRQLLGSSRIV